MHPDIATLRSRCELCDGRIHIGDWIVRSATSWWFHKECVQRAGADRQAFLDEDRR